MSTTGLQLEKFINSGLTWKTIAKGNRSARKPVARSSIMGMELSDNNARTSDTEKHGVAVLGRRFSEKIEHVPIKKRRFMLRSPSPPSRNSHLCLDDPEMILDKKQRRRGPCALTSTKFSQKILENGENKLDQSEDFSGIEILADVACNNSMICDGDHGEEKLQMEELKHGGVDLSTSVPSDETSVPSDETSVPSNETSVPSDETSVTAKGLFNEGKNEDTSAQDCVTNLHQDPTSNLRTIEGSTLSQEDRFPWDLNVVMHAEEQPFDTVAADLVADVEQSNSLMGREGQQILESTVIQGETQHLRENLQQIVVSSDDNEDHHKSDGVEPFHHNYHGVGDDGFKPDSARVVDCHPGECIPGSTGYGQESHDRKASKEIAYVGLCHDDQSLCQVLREENKVSSSCSLLVEQKIIKQENGLPVESKQPNTFIVMSSSIPKVEKIDCDNNCTMENECVANSEPASGSPEDDCRPVVFPSLGVQPRSQVGDSDDRNCSSGLAESAVPAVAKGDDQAVVAVNHKEEANEASAAINVAVTSPALAVSEEVMQKSSVDSTVTARGIRTMHDNNPSVKVAKDDPSDDSFESELCQADKVHTVGAENTLDLPAGYDFEDGELRESDYWDKNGEDGEVEHLDYGSDSEDLRLFGTENEEIKVERVVSPRSATGDALRDDSVSPKTRTSDVTTDYPAGVVGSRGSKNQSLSHVEVSETTHKDSIARSRADGFYEWEEKDAGSKRFSIRNSFFSNLHGKSPGGRFYVNRSTVYRNSERQYSPTYTGSCPSGPMRQRSVTDSRRHMNSYDYMGSEAGRFAGYDGRIRRQFNEHNTRKSPTNRDDANATRAGILPLRDISPVRNQFRRYPQGAGRGAREEYYRPMLEEDTGYGSRMTNRLVRRERSISPLGRRRSQYSIAYKNFRSRSRSRSPYTNMQPRERHLRPRSRSPIFRSDARMDRVRLPIQKHYTGAHEEQGFTSLPRNHFSPRRSSRWFDDRTGGLDNFRGRRSPVRMFRQSQRFESGRPVRRMNSNDEFRPMIQSKRFADMGAAARREEYEDCADDDRRKHNNRCEMVHRVRHHDIEGVVQRFRYNAEESFVATESHNYNDGNRVNDKRSRDGIRRASEE